MTTTHYYVCSLLDPVQLCRAKFDICASTERLLREQLVDVAEPRVWWEAELFERDEHGGRRLLPWTPGEVLPHGTMRLRCTASAP